MCSLHRPRDWPTWLDAAGVHDVDGNNGIKVENSALAYQAAIDGLGVVIAQRSFVEEDLKSGSLVAPFDLEVPGDGAYYLQLCDGPLEGRGRRRLRNVDPPGGGADSRDACGVNGLDSASEGVSHRVA